MMPCDSRICPLRRNCRRHPESGSGTKPTRENRVWLSSAMPKGDPRRRMGASEDGDCTLFVMHGNRDLFEPAA